MSLTPELRARIERTLAEQPRGALHEGRPGSARAAASRPRRSASSTRWSRATPAWTCWPTRRSAKASRNTASGRPSRSCTSAASWSAAATSSSRCSTPANCTKCSACPRPIARRRTLSITPPAAEAIRRAMESTRAGRRPAPGGRPALRRAVPAQAGHRPGDRRRSGRRARAPRPRQRAARQRHQHRLGRGRPRLRPVDQQPATRRRR